MPTNSAGLAAITSPLTAFCDTNAAGAYDERKLVVCYRQPSAPRLARGTVASSIRTGKRPVETALGRAEWPVGANPTIELCFPPLLASCIIAQHELSFSRVMQKAARQPACVVSMCKSPPRSAWSWWVYFMNKDQQTFDAVILVMCLWLLAAVLKPVITFALALAPFGYDVFVP